MLQKKAREGRSAGGEEGIERSTLTVSQASGHAGRGEAVALLRVDELAHRRQLVHFAVSWGAGVVRILRLHGSPAAGESMERYTSTSRQQPPVTAEDMLELKLKTTGQKLDAIIVF